MFEKRGGEPLGRGAFLFAESLTVAPIYEYCFAGQLVTSSITLWQCD